MHTAQPTAVAAPGLLPGLLLAVALHAFHAMAVAPVVPLVADDLDGLHLYGAAFGATLLASIVGLVWAGGSAAARGAAPTLARGLGAFAAGVLLCGVATSMPVWLIGRACEGFGGGVSTTVLYAAVMQAYPEAQRPRVLAWMSGAWILPGLLGPPVAGALAEWWSWRLVFLGIAPLVVLAAWLALPPLRRLPARPDPEADPRRLRHATLLAAGLGAVLAALARPPDAVALGMGGAGATALAFAASHLLTEGTLRARPGIGAAMATKFWIHFVFFGMEAFIPLGLSRILGWDPFAVGLVMTVSALTWTAGAFTNTRLAERFPPRQVGVFGAAAIVLGSAGTVGAVLDAASAGWIACAWSVAGFGMGIAYNTGTAAVMAATPRGHEGRNAASQGIADALGFALAAAIGGAFVAGAERAGTPIADAIRLAWLVAIVGGALVLPCMLRLAGSAPAPLPAADAA